MIEVDDNFDAPELMDDDVVDDGNECEEIVAENEQVEFKNQTEFHVKQHHSQRVRD